MVKGDTTYIFDPKTREMTITFKDHKGKEELLLFEGTIDSENSANRKGVLNKYGEDDTLYSTYTGESTNYKMHGQGKCEWYANRTSHDGMWNNDKKDGKGVSTWYDENGRVKYTLEGVWSDDGMWINKMDGKGVFTVYDENGRVKKTTEGVWLNDQLHNQGVSTWYDENGQVKKTSVVMTNPSAIQPPRVSKPSQPVSLLPPPPKRNLKVLSDRMNPNLTE